MIKFKCPKCGAEEFLVDKRNARVKCINCRKMYKWENEWKEFKRIKEIKSVARSIREAVSKKITRILETFETTGQIRKRLGIKKIKKKELKIPKIPTFEEHLQKLGYTKKDIEKLKHEGLKLKWGALIKKLKEKGYVEIKANEHYGSLRGKDVIKFAHRDLKKLGIKTRVKYHNYGGTIYLDKEVV